MLHPPPPHVARRRSRDRSPGSEGDRRHRSRGRDPRRDRPRVQRRLLRPRGGDPWRGRRDRRGRPAHSRFRARATRRLRSVDAHRTGRLVGGLDQLGRPATGVMAVCGPDARRRVVPCRRIGARRSMREQSSGEFSAGSRRTRSSFSSRSGRDRLRPIGFESASSRARSGTTTAKRRCVRWASRSHCGSPPRLGAHCAQGGRRLRCSSCRSSF